jgi:hypothetical protein
MIAESTYSLSTPLSDSAKELGLTGHKSFLNNGKHEMKQLKLNLAYTA